METAFQRNKFETSKSSSVFNSHLTLVKEASLSWKVFSFYSLWLLKISLVILQLWSSYHPKHATSLWLFCIIPYKLHLLCFIPVTKMSCRPSAARTSLLLKNCSGEPAELWPNLCFYFMLIFVDEVLAQRKFWFSHLGNGNSGHFHLLLVDKLLLRQGIWVKICILSELQHSSIPSASILIFVLNLTFFFWASCVCSMLSS